MGKHGPQRTCVACRQVKDKRCLVRLVRTADGTVEVDPTGSRAGRGAYLCDIAQCWETGIQRGGLERTLRTSLSAESRRRIMEEGVSLGRGVG